MEIGEATSGFGWPDPDAAVFWTTAGLALVLWLFVPG